MKFNRHLEEGCLCVRRPGLGASTQFFTSVPCTIRVLRDFSLKISAFSRRYEWRKVVEGWKHFWFWINNENPILFFSTFTTSTFSTHCQCHLGKHPPTKTDEFSEKFQTAFDPPPSFSENHIADFLKSCTALKTKHVVYF